MPIKVLAKVLGSRNDHTLRRMRKIVNITNDMKSAMEKPSDNKLRAKIIESHARLEKGEAPENLIPEAFVVIREASKCMFGIRHFNV